MNVLRRGLCLLVLLVGFGIARRPKRFTIDLDAPPDQRWNEVVEQHRDVIPGFMKVAETFVPKQLLPIAFWIAGELDHFFPDEYAEEIRGIAKASGLPLGLVVSMNILYDILAFDRKHVFKLGCTSIVAQNEDGLIFHGRNLDYEMGELLKNVTILVDFTRDKKVAYGGVTFALSSTLITGQNDAFSLSLNARYSGPYIYNIFMEFLTRFRTPVGFLLREFRITAQKMLKAMGQRALNADTMMKVLRRTPVRNNETLFSTVMSARFPSLIKNTTFIWD
ncbi:unnamed protein product [Heligmosomoides polygyrus]|uniref:NAAA-beta domain-containing protein n=1 Tax=Heligmosomoides polygyrus TaxID=6339 RepID=A0A3P7Z7F3_HELPZ|nr:unnamed protein product [Heligmosomoides polygyrus]